MALVFALAVGALPVGGSGDGGLIEDVLI